MAVFGTRALVFRVASTDFTSAVSDVRIKTAESDSDFVSFADAAAGGARDYTLVMTLAQDNATTSLWYYAWSQAGTDVAVEVWPAGRPGGGVATPSQPKFSGTCTVREPEGDFVGGEANASNTAKFTTEYEWKFTAKPTLAIS